MRAPGPGTPRPEEPAIEARMTYFAPATDAGQDLLDRHVLPMCSRLGLPVRVVRPPVNRSEGTRARFGRSTFVLWDGSLEEGPGTDDRGSDGHRSDDRGIYDALTMWAKIDRSNIIVSRTPLPQNVLTWHQFAPSHGSSFDNTRIAAWLEVHLAARLGQPPAAGPATPPEPDADPAGTGATGTEPMGHYWMYDRPARWFLSHRGSHAQTVRSWRDAFEQAHGTTVRMVPPQEFSYATEVVTRAQMWEGIARLVREIGATRRILLYLTEDYYDSFWCLGELLGSAQLGIGGRDEFGRRVGRLPEPEVAVPGEPRTEPLAPLAAELGLRAPDRDQLRRFRRLLVNCDPLTSAPETTIAPRGLGRPMAAVVRLFGYYDPAVVREDFWSLVRVPCPRCAPRGRRPSEVNWDAYLREPEPQGVDWFGYFPAHPSELSTGQLTCPTCGQPCRLVNRRGVRTLWAPVQTTEADQDRPVIRRLPVWEVLPS